MLTNFYLKNTANSHHQVTELDEKKKMASSVLKRVDHLIKSKDFQKALLETAHVKEIDPTNVYALAMEERIGVLLAEDIKKQQQKTQNNPAPESVTKKQKETPLQVQPKAVQNGNSNAISTQILPQQQLAANSAPVQKPSETPQELITTPIPDIKGKYNDSPKRRKPKVVIIDDDVILLSVLSMTIESGGFEVIALSTSDEAYVLLNKFIPDIILCDINLETSTMGGFSFFEKVQQIEHLKQVPFVFLTGLNDDVLIRTGKEMGADDYLTKPIKEQDLLAVIRGKTKRFAEIRKMVLANINTSDTALLMGRIQ